MDFVSDKIFDEGLSKLSQDTTSIHILSQATTSFIEATDTYSLGDSIGITITAPQDKPSGGRQVVTSTVLGGVITASGTATHYALVDIENSELLAVGRLSNSVVVALGNSFNLSPLAIAIPDPA